MLDGSEVERSEVKVGWPMGSFEGGGHTGCVTVRAEGVFSQRVIAGGGEGVICHP